MNMLIIRLCFRKLLPGAAGEATTMSMTLRVGPMTSNTRIDLKVPYAEKDQAKGHGAQWDLGKQTCYGPPAPI